MERQLWQEEGLFIAETIPAAKCVLATWIRSYLKYIKPFKCTLYFFLHFWYLTLPVNSLFLWHYIPLKNTTLYFYAQVEYLCTCCTKTLHQKTQAINLRLLSSSRSWKYHLSKHSRTSQTMFGKKKEKKKPWRTYVVLVLLFNDSLAAVANNDTNDNGNTLW